MNSSTSTATRKDPVIICTLHRGVFFGYVDPQQFGLRDLTDIEKAKMAIRWGTTKGVMELAATGPTKESFISAQADIPVLHDVTAIFKVTAEAEAQWITA